MLNQAQIIGHLGRDPEMRYTPGGEAIANLAIATTEKWKDKHTGEQKEKTEWHSVSAFGKLAEIMGQYLNKGSLLFVQGKITTRKYTDKDGIERYATEIRADTMKMLGGKPDGQPSQRPAQQNSGSFDDLGDDIPF